tara:strand:- start:236 stop:517 length:282 start_codon:yes stop_codon:yes gene_type:complete
MQPIRITFYHYAIVEMIAQGIFYDRDKFFEKVKDEKGSIYDYKYKQVKRISKKQCKEWIRGSLLAVGGGDAIDFNYRDKDYKLAQELIEKYNL